MSIQLDYSSNNWVRRQFDVREKELERRQREINNILGYDLCASLVFNKCRNTAVVKSVYTEDEEIKNELVGKNILCTKRYNSILRRLIKTKDVVEFHGEKTLLVKDGRSEAFIPLFLPKEDELTLIGCIYLLSYESKCFPMELLLENDVLDDYIYETSRFLALSLSEIEQVAHTANIINLFINILNKKDHFLINHSYNVANLCKEIGIELGLGSREIEEVYMAGLVHDLGKIMVREDILTKEGRLTDEEYAEMKEHAVFSYNIAKSLVGHIEVLERVPDIVKYHHERYDGKGYPFGLKGDEVPICSYIIAIADAVDAMLFTRVYREAMSLNEVIRELYENKGTQFHPKLVDIVVDKLVETEKEFEKTLNNTMNLGSLIVTTKDDILILEGSLIKERDYYIFSPFNEGLTRDLKLSDIVNIEVIIKNLNNLHHFQTKIEDFVDNEFLIFNLKFVALPNSFNLLWNLEGTLHYPSDEEKSPIQITKVGGDALSFIDRGFVIDDLAYKNPLKITIHFEEYDVEISGNIVRSYNFGSHRYYDIFYTDIPDSKRDTIFRQLFRKQIELRRTIVGHKQ